MDVDVPETIKVSKGGSDFIVINAEDAKEWAANGYRPVKETPAPVEAAEPDEPTDTVAPPKATPKRRTRKRTPKE